MPATTKVFNRQISNSAELAEALKLAMSYAGYSEPVETTSGSTIYLHFSVEVPVDNYTIHLQVGITSSLGLKQILLKDWSPSASNVVKSYAGDTEDYDQGLIIFNCCNHPELRVVDVYQKGAENFLIGAIRPLHKENYWDESVYPFVFTAASSAGNPSFYSFDDSWSPHDSYSYAFDSFSQLRYRNRVTQKYNIITGVFFLTNSGEGICGTFSEEVGRAAASDAIPGDLNLETVDKIYLILTTGTSGIVVETYWPESM
ncbi:MAG: hypothetical protein F6J89_02185 [Symploca sp. SIO1C4]|uniref:Uncharacterized protein n=1 Tax=Symploca sp. SIO1C4 TaxID=2607765 RepID=A0A6B3N4J2_9CYAN|nr:hypothetical protein [Symploca sp. SIO1C4]